MANACFAEAHLDDPGSLERLAAFFAEWNPGLRVGHGRLTGEEEWTAAPGSRVCWLQDGEGEVSVPAGYRTKEGDGEPLPATYRPEPVPREWVEAVAVAAARIGCFEGELRQAVDNICARLAGEHYIGDAANDLWTWIQYGGRAPDAEFAAFLALFERIYDQVGYSYKTRGGWEPLRAGDQILAGAEALRVRGELRYWWIETPRPIAHISTLRRLRYLRDTAGGCNIKFDAFRRMSLTWYAGRGVTPDNPDGINQVNSHFVNIAAETSRAHYHPRAAVGGGRPQGEMYFVLDPAAYRLSTRGRAGGVELWPEVEGKNRDLKEKLTVPLRPGSAVYITPGTAHRGMDVFANVVVLPGYKPGNQFFVQARS